MELNEAITQLQNRTKDLVFKQGTTGKDWLNLLGEFTALTNEFPDHPALLFGLGNVFLHMDMAASAIACFDKSARTGAIGAPPYLNMANAYKTQHKDDEASKCYDRAIDEAKKHPSLDDRQVNMDLSSALHGKASLHVNAGKPQECVYWADKALKVDPDDRFAWWNKGLAHLELGEWQEGFRIYDEIGFKESPLKPRERKLKTYGGLPFWDGTPGKTVITYGEQGVGDEIMFASIIPDLMNDCKVIIDCDHRIEQMLKRSFPETLAVYPTSDINAPFPWVADHKIDAHVSMGSLGKFYRKKTGDFPKVAFLKADTPLVNKWQKILRPYAGLKVGISWAGGLKKTRFDKRTIALEQWEPILRTEGAHFFSLQYHPWAADDCARVGSQLGIPIHHWQDMVRDYEETAGFLMNMDVVITVNTSLHHLCGALGVKQLCLTPTMCAWRYGTKGPSPFYGNCEMMRQVHDDEWVPVIGRTAEIISKLTMQEAA